jgi:hypothetical protein
VKRWQDRAECRGLTTNLFFPENPNQTREARQVCARCSVREDCLSRALNFDPSEDRAGVFGATTPRQRRQLRRATPEMIRWNQRKLTYELGAFLRWDKTSGRFVTEPSDERLNR